MTHVLKTKDKHSGRAYQSLNPAQGHDSVAWDKISGECRGHSACWTILTGAGKLVKWKWAEAEVILCVSSKNVSGNYWPV